MILTDWHHLFGITLKDYFAGTAYTVELEADLSLKKQRLDVVIIDKQEGKPPDTLADGLENLAAHNLLSYKSIHEPFDDWAADELIGHYVNYRKQTSPSLKKLLPKDDFRLYAVSTRYPRKLAGKISFRLVMKGVYDLLWGVRNIRLIVASEIPQAERNAMWLMFSAVQKKIEYGVACYQGKFDEMSSAINQLLIKYRNERIIDMPYTLEDYRKEVERNVLSSITPERILEEIPLDKLLKGVPTEQRIKGIPTEQLLKGISTKRLLKEMYAKEMIKGLSIEELEEIEAYVKKLRQKAEGK